MRTSIWIRLLAVIGFSVSLLLSTAHATEVITYYHNDALGSPVAATDQQGKLLWHEEYEPYGKRLVVDAETQGEEQFYTGKQEEAELGLHYFGARWYSPEAGRFLSMDPEGFHEGNFQSFNRYAYANNNPYRYVDPDGNSPLDVGFFAVDALSFAIAVASGNPAAMGSAGVDLTMSAIGLVSPVPGTGQVMKAFKIVDKVGGRNLPFKDADRLGGVNKTLDRIESGGPFPYKKDGSIFKNKEGKLPEGNYREYTVDTPDASNRGARRVVQDGDSGRAYYTDDHYENFIQIDPMKR